MKSLFIIALSLIGFTLGSAYADEPAAPVAPETPPAAEQVQAGNEVAKPPQERELAKKKRHRKHRKHRRRHR